MSKSQETRGFKLSKYFGTQARKLFSGSAKRFDPVTDYTYLQSGNAEVIAAHGLSLQWRPYLDDPKFDTEASRKTAEILHEAHGDERLVAAMLLQEIATSEPAEADFDETTPYNALDKLFSGNVMAWVSGYRDVMQNYHDTDVLDRSLPGVKRMKLAHMIERLDHTRDQLQNSWAYNINHQPQPTAAYSWAYLHNNASKDHLSPKEQHDALQYINNVEARLDKDQERFRAVRGIDRTLDGMFVDKMCAFRDEIESWKIDNGFDADAQAKQQPHPPKLTIS
ncbi:MAG: hypothetical protein QF692_03035 [Alphaproteobacteria bacterium]|jgi:hypothetical protein|nr:hypothetical protein [Alphaproteobacteria bacterium]MDP7222218.1 hypothetical protein [Alphaproteobacteria bacterium]